MEPEFLDVETVTALHEQVMLRTPSERREIMSMARLEAALALPQNHYAYGRERDLIVLAAVYAWHLAKDHAFMSGNKRVAQAASITFLAGNGVTCRVDDDSFAKVIEAIINNVASFDDLADYLRSCVV